jgi:nitrite reductase/ring-hydroxylating ferredoxin subunit
VFAGNVLDYPKNLGQAVKHGNADLAVFHLPNRSEEEGQWFATQNLSPNKQSKTISRGLVGQTLDGIPTVAEPIWKATYNLTNGKGISTSGALNLSTFRVRVSGDQVEVFVPPADELAAAFEKQCKAAIDGANFVKPKPYPYNYVSLGGASAVHGVQPRKDLDW